MLAVGVNSKVLGELTGERYDAVNSVVNEIRPNRRTRRKVADEIARRVYEEFGVPPEDRPQPLA